MTRMLPADNRPKPEPESKSGERVVEWWTYPLIGALAVLFPSAAPFIAFCGVLAAFGHFLCWALPSCE